MFEKKSELLNAKMMISKNKIDLDFGEGLACKCQNCNNVILKLPPLNEHDIEEMFKKLVQ